MINFSKAFIVTSLHDFKDNVRLLRFGYFDSVKLFVVEINAILVRLLAHFTTEFLPVKSDTTFLF